MRPSVSWTTTAKSADHFPSQLEKKEASVDRTMGDEPAVGGADRRRGGWPAGRRGSAAATAAPRRPRRPATSAPDRRPSPPSPSRAAAAATQAAPPEAPSHGPLTKK